MQQAYALLVIRAEFWSQNWHEKKATHARWRRGLMDNIKTDLKATVWEVSDWNYLSQDMSNAGILWTFGTH